MAESNTTIEYYIIWIRCLIFFACLFGQFNSYCQVRKNSSLDICKAAKNPYTYIDNVIKYPSDYISGNDCVFKLVDTITTLAISGHNKFLFCLGKLYAVSDGEITEYFEDKGNILFYKSFNSVINYVYEKRDQNIEKMLVNSLSMEVSASADRKKEMFFIISFIKQEEKEYHFPMSKRKFLTGFEKKINPAIFD